MLPMIVPSCSKTFKNIEPHISPKGEFLPHCASRPNWCSCACTHKNTTLFQIRGHIIAATLSWKPLTHFAFACYWIKSISRISSQIKCFGIYSKALFIPKIHCGCMSAMALTVATAARWTQMDKSFLRAWARLQGSCPWCKHFHLLVDVRETDSSGPWIKMVWAGRLWEQSPLSGRPCCSASHEMHYLLLILSASVWLLLFWSDQFVCGPESDKIQSLHFWLRLC